MVFELAARKGVLEVGRMVESMAFYLEAGTVVELVESTVVVMVEMMEIVYTDPLVVKMVAWKVDEMEALTVFYLVSPMAETMVF